MSLFTAKLFLIIIACISSLDARGYKGQKSASGKFIESNDTCNPLVDYACMDLGNGNYTEKFRTASCWDCFDARGKMCSYKNGTSMVGITHSSNSGHGICCKPDYIGYPCNDLGKLVCSQPVAGNDTSTKYKNILTTGLFGKQNYQMFAFFPKTNPKTCGISTIASQFYDGNMKLYVDEKPRTISLRENYALKYREGRPQIRSYDSCYYEINPSEEINMRTQQFWKSLI